jgi:hypothetical protein
MEQLQEKIAAGYDSAEVGADPNSVQIYRERRDLALQNQKKAQAEYQEAYEKETGRKSSTFGCLIATATFGSPQASEVQLVRDYRDGMIRQTIPDRGSLRDSIYGITLSALR